MDARLFPALIVLTFLCILGATMKWRSVLFSRKEGEVGPSFFGALLMTLVSAGMAAATLWFWR
jgi:hypothetical protein